MTDLDRDNSENRSLKVLVVARTPVAEYGLATLLEEAGFLVTTAEDRGYSDSVVERATDVIPDALVVEWTVGSIDGAGVKLSERFRSVPAVILADAMPASEDSRESAARAWLTHDAGVTEIVAALHAVVAGLNVLDPRLVTGDAVERSDGGVSPVLTPREGEVLSALSDGLTNKEIATDLGISEHTVKYHVSSILARLDVSSRTEAVSAGIRLGLITL